MDKGCWALANAAICGESKYGQGLSGSAPYVAGVHSLKPSILKVGLPSWRFTRPPDPQIRRVLGREAGTTNDHGRRCEDCEDACVCCITD